jgi:hypothetical protein
MNELALIDESPKAARLYERMQTAIAACHSLDDCKAIAEQAAAIAAYHKQIKDDESVRKFLQIKLRAWRRIGELLNEIDCSDCETLTARYRKIRSVFQGVAAVDEMSDSAMREALRVASLPADFFERNVEDHGSIYSIMFAYERLQRERWAASPEGQEELKQQEQRNKRWREEDAQRTAEQKAKAAAEAAAAEREHKTIVALMAAHEEAVSEVGVTLDRRDRERMREIVFLIKDQIHEALRQAAFDQRMTMQAVLRSGLAMWFIAHGYDVPLSEMDLRPKPKRHP